MAATRIERLKWLAREGKSVDGPRADLAELVFLLERSARLDAVEGTTHTPAEQIAVITAALDAPAPKEASS